jgi:hypothetical protein
MLVEMEKRRLLKRNPINQRAAKPPAQKKRNKREFGEISTELPYLRIEVLFITLNL